MEDVYKRTSVNDEFFFLFLNLSVVPNKSTPRLTFSAKWNKRDRVWYNAIHFISDGFAAIAVVDAKAPYYHLFSSLLVSHLWSQKQQQQQQERDLFISIPQKGLKN